MESGLPGRPNTSVAPRRPNHSGLPGLSRTRQNTSSTPAASSAGLTWSCGPTETPPETSSTSPASAGLDRGARGGQVVGDDRVHDDLGAGALGEQPQREPVGLVDPARLRRRAHLEQLRPGREHVDDRAPAHRDLADAGGGERGDALDGERRAGGREHVAAGDVLAAVADVVPAAQRPGRRHAVAVERGVLDAQDRVGAVGQRRAGRDPQRGPGRERGGGHLARGDSPAIARGDRRVGVGGAHRVAVHRGAVERREVDGAARVLGGDPPGRGARAGRARRGAARRAPRPAPRPRRSRAGLTRRSATSSAAAGRTPARRRGA